MTLRSPLRVLAVGASLSVLVVLPRQAVAQPDGGPRTMMPPAPIPQLPPLTFEEIEKATGGSTTVTYSGQNVSVVDVAKALMNAAGQDLNRLNVMTRENAAAPKISVDWKDKPFWDAAREVETLTGMRWAQSPMGGMVLVPAATSNGANLNGNLIVDSPYVKIYADSVTHTTVSKASLADANAPVAANNATQLRLFVYYDPRLKVQGGSLEVKDIHLPQGTELAPGDAALGTRAFDLANTIMGGRRGSSFVEPFNVELPNGLLSETTLSKISATARFSTALGDKKWVVDDLLNAADAQENFEKANYTVDSAVVEGKQLKVHLLVEREPGANNGPNMPFDMAGINPLGGLLARNDNGVPANAVMPNAAMPNITVNIGGLPNMAQMPNLSRFRMMPQLRTFSDIKVRDANGQLLSNRGMSNSNGGGGNRNKMEATLNFDLTDAANGPLVLEWNLPAEPRNAELRLS